ncbi:hypothetical protein, partial [Nocardia gipuzkoensis]|uniref:hypothetical protein n=1 Tax=Nocardia gipuzkoensis TaxID=2749991 RepID=UPI00237DE465
MRREAHAGFGERPGETERQQCRHRAPGRLNHLIAHRALPRPVGSSERVTRYRHFSAACSVVLWNLKCQGRVDLPWLTETIGNSVAVAEV